MARKGDSWSVTSLMKASMYVAVNFAAFRAIGMVGVISRSMAGRLFVTCLLTILNLLFFGFSRWHRGRTDREFWDWFELIGWGAIGLMLTFADALSVLIVAPMDWLVGRQWIDRGETSTNWACLLGLIVVVYGLPPLAAATFTGWMSSRYRVMIERRPRASVAGPTADGSPGPS